MENIRLRMGAKVRKQKIFRFDEWPRTDSIHLEDYIVDDTWDRSGRIRIREKIREGGSEIKIVAEIPLLVNAEGKEIMTVSLKTNDGRSREMLEELRGLILCEEHLRYRREVSLSRTNGWEGMIYLNRNVHIKRLGSANFYMDDIYNAEGANWVEYVTDKRKLEDTPQKEEDAELEIEREMRVYIEPFEQIEWINKFEDIYDANGRLRIRDKNGSLRYSIKVPLLGKDTERTKCCIRLEWKPETGTGEDLLRKIKIALGSLEGSIIKGKLGGKLKIGGGFCWINKNGDGKYWMEYDVEEGMGDELKEMPEGLRAIGFKKSEIPLR